MTMTMTMTMKYSLYPCDIQFIISKLTKEIIHITCVKSINLTKGLEAMDYVPQWNIFQNHKPSIYQHMQEMCCRSLDLKLKAKLRLESGNQKIQYDNQAANLKVIYLKINRLLSIQTSNVLLKLGLCIQSKTEVRVRKPKNPRWSPGGHFESDKAENQLASADVRQQHASEILN